MDSDCAGGQRCDARRCVAPDAGDAGDAGDDLDAAALDADLDAAADADAEDASADVESDGLILVSPLRVSPEALDLGSVGLLNSVFSSVNVRNQGFVDIDLERLALESSSQAFTLFQGEGGPILTPGEAREVVVRFRPTALAGGRETPYNNTLLIQPRGGAAIRVPLTGLALPKEAQCMDFLTLRSELGYLPPGEEATATATLRSCGSEPITVTRLELEGAAGGLEVVEPPSLPLDLAPQELLQVQLRYAPSSPPTPLRAQLRAQSAGGLEARYEVLGGPICPTARIFGVLGNARSISRLAGFSSQNAGMDGRGSRDPAEGPLIYRWKIDAPERSRELEITPDLESPIFNLRCDVGGLYTISLNVESELTGLISCRPATLVLDLFPDPAPIELTLSWDSAVDLDLHVLRSEADGSYGPFSYLGPREVNPNDVFYENLNPEFGDPELTWDNPLHDGDTQGEVPERVRLSALEPGRRYKVGVHFALRRGAESARAALTVRVGDRTMRYERTLTEVASFWIPVVLDGTTGRVEVEDALE